MDRTFKSLPLDGFRPELSEPALFEIARAAAQVDGDSWGELEIDEVQRRLEALDDFAIVQLEARFFSEGLIPRARVRVTDTGLRNIGLDGTYLTPSREAGIAGLAIYEMPAALAEGEHRLVWSYAWNPPVEAVTGARRPDGVTLVRPVVAGSFRVRDGGVAALPEAVDLRNLAAAGLGGEDVRVALSRSVRLPMGLGTLLIEGPSTGTLEVLLDQTLLVPVETMPVHRFRIDPFMEGEATLTLRFTGPPRRVTSIRLVR